MAAGELPPAILPHAVELGQHHEKEQPVEKDGAAIGALGMAEGLLGSALGRFYAVAEAYPDLKANETISQLMEELTSSENKVAFARQAFNDAVTDYNNRREQFPANVIAGVFRAQLRMVEHYTRAANSAAPRM